MALVIRSPNKCHNIHNYTRDISGVSGMIWFQVNPQLDISLHIFINELYSCWIVSKLVKMCENGRLLEFVLSKKMNNCILFPIIESGLHCIRNFPDLYNLPKNCLNKRFCVHQSSGMRLC